MTTMRGLLAAAIAATSMAAAPAIGGETKRVSVDSAGTQGNNTSYYPSISGDGRYVAFWSHATNLVSGDTNSGSDVFVHDRVNGTTELVSVNSAGTQGNNTSYYPSISGDGRYVAFWSHASNLVSSDTNGFVADVFVHDRQTGTTELVSVNSAGTQGNNTRYYPSISGDGRYVAFWSYATDLVSGDTNDRSDVFVHDRQTGMTERVSVHSSGAEGNHYSYDPSISGDGRYVAFWSYASTLVSGDTNNRADVFVHDQVNGTTERVSVDSGGTEGTAHSFGASISGDGRYIAFYSDASDLVPDDSNLTRDVFVHDRQTGTTERVSVDSSGAEGNSFSATGRARVISADGGVVAFSSAASNLVPGDTNGRYDVFVRVRQDNGVPVADAGGPYTVNEGGSVALDGGGSSDPDGDPLTYAWDLDGDSQFDDATDATPTFDASALDGPDSVTVSVEVSDGTETATASTTVTILNVAPTLGSIAAPLDPVPVGEEVTASAPFNDPGTADAHTVTIDWGDGTSAPGTVASPASGSHTYSIPGVYTVAMTVTDDDGGSNTGIYQYVVVFDPSGSFVTGGGHIDSPAGAYVADPSLSGRATFGFVSKYKKGATTPSGNTQFKFKAGDLAFQSTAYDWLVVAGPQAKFKGVGTINAAGDYGFQLFARDSAVNGGGTSDAFRIKIWDRSNGDAVVYDNEMGAADDADPTTPLTGGSIQIHEAKGGGNNS